MIRCLEEDDAVEVHGGRGDAPVFFTCEHASARMPDGYAWPESDRRWSTTHWAFDLGARDLALELADRLDAHVVLSRFSRLLVDPNRPEDWETLFRTVAEGEPIALNASIDEMERARRIARFLRPYHEAVDRWVARSSAPTLCAIHTFTPVYEGQKRELEIGVLFDRDERLGESMARDLVAAGYRTALNEPYSGKLGLVYAVDRHATAHRRAAVELEVRQDLAVDPAFRRGLVDVLGQIFSR